MRLLITETDMPSPQGRFAEWLDVLKITKRGPDVFDAACLMSDDEEIRLLQPAFLEEYE